MYPKKEIAQLVMAACSHYKIDTVVVSPGSRNAPLTVGFSNHSAFKTLSVVDERCAAFFALGIAQQSQKPVALVCTSGSALLNYYPAIAEAFYSNIPLVIISADRPKHLIDIGDGQTIRQENVFANHILYSANLKDATIDANPEISLQNRKEISEALQTAIVKKGPVHINVPLDEPLYETVANLKTFTFQEKVITNNLIAPKINEFSKIWNTSTKKMILIGVHFPEEALQHIINKFAEDESVLLLTETTSNIYNKYAINSIDKLIFTLDEEQSRALQPEVLVTFGGLVVSKKIKQFLRKYQPKQHWHIDAFKSMDTFHCLTDFIKDKPHQFLESLKASSTKVKSNYRAVWFAQKQEKAKKHHQFLNNCAYSDLKVFEQVLESIPNDTLLQLSNSSVIRYAQLFDVKPSLDIFCNRGTSGIDGSTSTAIGTAFAVKKQTVFITGDLSFFYDSNALWNNYVPKNFRIIIVNNAGGGIFRVIPGPQKTNATAYFETPHQLTAAHLSAMYNFEYTAVSNLESLKNTLSDFYSEAEQPKILEIFTPREINDVILKNYFKHL